MKCKVRQLALAWWRRLTEEEKRVLASTYCPGKTFLEVTTSSMLVEQVYREAEME